MVRSETAPESEQAEDVTARGVANFIQRIDQAREKGNKAERAAAMDSDAQQAADIPPPQEAQGTENKDVTTQRPSAPQPTSQPVEPPQPPALISVSAHAAPGYDATVGQPPGPAVNAATAARGAPISLRGYLEGLVPPENAPFREQLDLKLLRVVAGDYDLAREPLRVVTAEQQEIATRFVEALIAIREGHMGDLAGAATTASQQLAELQESLRKLSDLSLPVLQICSAVRGYGQYDVLDPPRFAAGTAAEFVLYCEVRDFVSERRSDDCYYTTFDMTTTILNRVGDSVHEIKDVDITDRCRNRRQDCFIPRLVRLPVSLSPGQYVAKVTIVDKLGQKVAENRAPFQLVARP